MQQQLHWLIDFEQQLSGAITIRYENFIDDNIDDLEAYLEFPILRGETHVSFKHVARTKQYGHWKNWFLEDDCDVFRPIFEPYLRQYDYVLDWSLNEKQVIKPEYCSKYVRRVIQERAQENGLQNIVIALGKGLSKMGTFTTHNYTVGDEIEINDGFNQVFGLNRPIEDWKWKFAPVYEKSWILIARDELKQLIAHYAVIHQPMQIKGQQIHAGQNVDVYRIKRPSTAEQMVFTQTAQTFFKTYCAPDKLVYLFGFPGKRALPVGQTRLDYTGTTPIYNWYKTIPSQSMLDRMRRVTPISIHNADLNAIDDLWLRAMNRYPFSLIRDRHRIQHRFIDHPKRDYFYLPVESNNQLHAWGILLEVDGILKWVDLIWDGQTIKHVQQLEQDIIRLAQSLDIKRVEMWILGDNDLIEILRDQDWQKETEPFVHLFGRAWHPDFDAQEIIKHMYITLGDSDLI